jgi:hypothetical protein
VAADDVHAIAVEYQEFGDEAAVDRLVAAGRHGDAGGVS